MLDPTFFKPKNVVDPMLFLIKNFRSPILFLIFLQENVVELEVFSDPQIFRPRILLDTFSSELNFL